MATEVVVMAESTKCFDLGAHSWPQSACWGKAADATASGAVRIITRQLAMSLLNERLESLIYSLRNQS
jgi:hypothetical protein